MPKVSLDDVAVLADGQRKVLLWGAVKKKRIVERR